MLRTLEKVMVTERLRPAYGETPDRVRCLENGDGDPEQTITDSLGERDAEWLDRWSWSPGNHTRYDLIYGCRQAGSDEDRRSEFVVGYLHRNVMMVFTEPGYLHHTYIEEKLGVNVADAVGIMMFLEMMGHAVGYPDTDTMTRLVTTYPGFISAT